MKKSRGVTSASWLLSSEHQSSPYTDWLHHCLLSTCSWCVVRAYTWLALWLSLLSTCSWCVVRAYTWLSLWLSLLSTCSWCVVRAYTWLSIWLSLLSTCSWCVVRAYTWLSIWLSLLSTCSWCVVRAYTWLALWLSLLSTCSWCGGGGGAFWCTMGCVASSSRWMLHTGGGWGYSPLRCKALWVPRKALYKCIKLLLLTNILGLCLFL